MNQINHKKSEFLALKSSWVLEEDNSRCMIPQQGDSKLWVGITEDNLEYVRCLNPERPRVIAIDKTNILTCDYEEYGKPV